MHAWNVTPSEARRIQDDLRHRIVLTPLSHTPKSIAGVDVSCNRYEKTVYAGIIVLSFPELQVLEYQVHKNECIGGRVFVKKGKQPAYYFSWV